MKKQGMALPMLSCFFRALSAYLPFPVSQVTLQQQLGLQAKLEPLGLGRQVVQPLVLQTLRRAHPAAAGEEICHGNPAPPGPFSGCPARFNILDKETALNEQTTSGAASRDARDPNDTCTGGAKGTWGEKLLLGRLSSG